MSRRLSAISLLCAWLCASGAMLDVAQVFAWTRMFAGYARTESIAAAVKETFDPGKPCAICRVVSHARDAADQRAPAAPSAGSEKIVLIFEGHEGFVAVSAERAWPAAPSARALARGGDVPVPPPRGLAPTALS
jgi:hypothetical protein